jgi:serine O-acetyltransferase
LTLAIFRIGQFCHTSTSLAASVLKPVWRIADMVYLRTWLHCEMPAGFNCGPGLSLPHAGRGVVVHRDAALGANSMMYHRVTLGAQDGGAPTIGHDVTIGAGACLLGPVRVGEFAKIGANAVVVSDVGAGETAAGVPARVSHSSG